eukprot:CAMPEP_0171109500 /NCGR_PEP_ID=MMETSP0766_2-20121228/70814_1 /TAXON_ID=439317 /ORGANISM="Gambierdiscus australes, Strain CAWD 149" /LENGTH=197 /DNA_ID=CAMNT_0011571245 /DNA_START=139 /DNA_END=732 /DNA_ORIENTATION=+
MALPPSAYGQPKGSFWKGLNELERYPPMYPPQEELFDEYLSNKSMMQSRHTKSLSKSRGLLELHYDSMRKKQMERAARPTFIHGPTMDRPFAATTGYSGFIPGKDSENVCGCTFANGSRIAHDTRGRFYDGPLSGVTFTLGSNRGPMSRSRSSPQFSNSQSMQRHMGATAPGGSFKDASRSPFRASELKHMMPGEFD